jgi:hypothetical protein
MHMQGRARVACQIRNMEVQWIGMHEHGGSVRMSYNVERKSCNKICVLVADSPVLKARGSFGVSITAFKSASSM